MKLRMIVLSCLVGVFVLFASYQLSLAQGDGKFGRIRIGVVSVKEIFQDCKKIANYREEASAEREKIEAELEKLEKEIEAEKAGLKTLVSGSSDHMQRVKELLMKQASYEAQRKFYEQHLAMKKQRIIEDLYADIIKKTKEVAKDKGLDLVLEESEPELPAVNSNELTLTISTHKLLYSGGCEDITDAVKMRLDASE